MRGVTEAGSCRAGDATYDAFVHRHGRRHGSAEEYEGRRQVFHENRGRIEAWNARGGSHECAPGSAQYWSVLHAVSVAVTLVRLHRLSVLWCSDHVCKTAHLYAGSLATCWCVSP